MNRNKLLLTALRAAIDAGEAILSVYHTDFDVQTKDDHSPLTVADQNSHNIIKEYLKDTNIPVLSEEGRKLPYETRQKWELLWIVDPLDGTKEFIKRNDEFTVNIALIKDRQPILGVIYIPVKDILYFAESNLGAFRLDSAQVSIKTLAQTNSAEQVDEDAIKGLKAVRLPLEGTASNDVYTIVGSRSHATKDLEDFVAQKQKELGKVQFISAGSSLKICLVAEGRADIYPRLGPTMEWDTAAGQAVAQIAGAQMVDYQTGNPLAYNKQDLLNPWFIVKRN